MPDVNTTGTCAGEKRCDNQSKYHNVKNLWLAFLDHLLSNNYTAEQS